MFENNRIVMVTPARLGDTLMCTPAIHLLKQTCPSVKIDIIALSVISADVLRNNPDIDRVFVRPEPATLPSYDRAINIHHGPEAQHYLDALNVPLDTIGAKDPHIHQAEQAVLFMQKLLSLNTCTIEKNYRLFPSPEDFAHVETIFRQHGVDLKKDILLGCQIGCHSIAKKRFTFLKKLSHPKIWPLEHVVELAQKLHAYNPRIKLVIPGSNSEKALGKKLEKRAPNIVNFIDQTTVPQLYSLMKYLKLFISSDTGLMHVACASNVPLIALFGHTSLTRTGPYPKLKDLALIQRPSMEAITVDEVLQAVINKL
ncbi:MAG: ADP-heptose--LPS heptosyltransferase [Gammaproteobacteria bacterium]|nr:ADP-heptose--LPS heptosyltransferase [Gammaproteobacteria bacterium]